MLVNRITFIDKVNGAINSNFVVCWIIDDYWLGLSASRNACVGLLKPDVNLFKDTVKSRYTMKQPAAVAGTDRWKTPPPGPASPMG